MVARINIVDMKCSCFHVRKGDPLYSGRGPHGHFRSLKTDEDIILFGIP